MKVLILNSEGFSDIGWVTEPATQKILADSLARADLRVDLVEVASRSDLDQVLRSLEPQTLVWPNAYYVRALAGGEETLWLAEALEAMKVPFVGPSAATLRAVLHKDRCQARLAAAGIPVPRFTTVTHRDPDIIRAATRNAGLVWPLVAKPTSMADSIGIAKVNDLDELVAQIDHILDRLGSRAIIEEYLPSADITIGILVHGSEIGLMPTWYEMTDREGVLDHPTRLQPWGGPKQMRLVEDESIIEQVQGIGPHLAQALEIRDFTRIDGRLDGRGQLKIFDVNGMPSLDFPHTVTLRQIMTVWPRMDAARALDRLVCNVVGGAARRYGLKAPAAVAANALPFDGPSGIYLGSSRVPAVALTC